MTEWISAEISAPKAVNLSGPLFSLLRSDLVAKRERGSVRAAPSKNVQFDPQILAMTGPLRFTAFGAEISALIHSVKNHESFLTVKSNVGVESWKIL